MLAIEDTRLWFAIAALATALVFTAGSAQGTLRCGYYTGVGENCFSNAESGSAARVFRQMADERRRCSYFEPACRVRASRDTNGRAAPTATTGGFPVPPRGTSVHPLHRGSEPPQPGRG
jgi:hypothetical protein